MAFSTDQQKLQCKVRVLAIVGCARSGSTLVEGVLQDRFDICSLGEVCYLWERGFLRDESCGCGNPFSRCEFWQSVLKDAFGSVSEADARRFDTAFRSARGTLLDFELTFRRAPRVDPLFADIAKPLYRSARRIGGRRLLDSSKVPRFAASLQDAGIVQVDALHLFRDPCGNVHSLRNAKVRPQARSGSERRMGRSKSIFHAVLRWKLRNIQSQRLLSRARSNALTVSYEAFCRNPDTHLQRFAETYRLEARNRDAARQWHSVSGNPMRFTEEKLVIRLDERWRDSMSATDQAIVRLLSSAQQARMKRLAE
ncbi:MAG: hypothetical protein AB7U35_06880 [Sphingobium sp.]